MARHHDRRRELRSKPEPKVITHERSATFPSAEPLNITSTTATHMNTILIFGGTGFIGLSLAHHLKERGLNPILIARSKPDPSVDFEFRKWDAVTLGDWKDDLENALAIVNLTGKTVDCIKTPDNCDLILRSRVDATTVIGKAFREVAHPPKIWIQMSTAHIYGDPPTQLCDEDSSHGYGLAPIVGKAWEEAFFKALPDGVRGVRLRTSFVIGKNGGALASLKRIAKLGFGGTVSHGNQGMSWIHEYDMNELIYQSIIDEKFTGMCISSAPNPKSNKEFMKLLRKKAGVPIGIPSPKFLVKFGSKWIFRTDPDLVLYGRYVKSKRLEEKGFEFKFPELEGALEDLLKK